MLHQSILFEVAFFTKVTSYKQFRPSKIAKSGIANLGTFKEIHIAKLAKVENDFLLTSF